LALGGRPSFRQASGSVLCRHLYFNGLAQAFADIYAREQHAPCRHPCAEKNTIASDYGDLRERIRTAYLAVTGGMFNKRALLSEVRKHLPNVDRATLDNALELMQRDGDATLMQLDNRPDITPADEEAAIRIGQEARHILWISQ
jgi:hypothetical protein